MNRPIRPGDHRQPALRASDADRERVATLLGESYAEGRLALDEFQERLEKAYASKTVGELETLTWDLPTPDMEVAPPAQYPSRNRSRRVVNRFLSYGVLMLFLVAVWAVTGAPSSFWPIWPILVGALVLVFDILHLRRPPRPARLRRQVRRQERRQRRQWNRLQQIWDWYEGIDHYLHPAESIVDAPWGVFRVTVDRYAGPAFTLPDDTFVSGGDQLCRLHISYPVLMRLVAQSPAQLERAMTDDLQALAASIERGYLPRNIRAVYSVTILAHGSERLGFSVRRRPRTEPRAIGPDEVWMSRDELLRRYGSRPSSRY